MNKIGATLLLVAIAIAATAHPGEAGWKKRGWYLKKPGTECAMRQVTVSTAYGKAVARAIRVCR
jgi:hypothetical protein